MSERLKELLIDEEDILQEILAEILKKYVNITKTGKIIYNENFGKLDTERKVIISYLAYLARKLLGLSKDEKASAKDIASETGMNYGTVRSVISKLVRSGILNREERGQYYIALSKVKIVKEKYFGE